MSNSRKQYLLSFVFCLISAVLFVALPLHLAIEGRPDWVLLFSSILVALLIAILVTLVVSRRLCQNSPTRSRPEQAIRVAFCLIILPMAVHVYLFRQTTTYQEPPTSRKTPDTDRGSYRGSSDTSRGGGTYGGDDCEERAKKALEMCFVQKGGLTPNISDYMKDRILNECSSTYREAYNSCRMGKIIGR